VQGLGWIFLALSTWAVLFFTTDLKRFRAFWTGGIWSIGLAVLGEGLIRSNIDYFVERSLIFPLLRTDFLNFFGPRFVEGVLFMQTLRPQKQLKQVSFWVIGIVLSEMALALTGQITLSLNGIGLALAVHSLRFLSLLGIHGALNYGLARQRIIDDQKEEARQQQNQKAGRILWSFGWPVFGLGSALALKAARRLDRLVVRSMSRSK